MLKIFFVAFEFLAPPGNTKLKLMFYSGLNFFLCFTNFMAVRGDYSENPISVPGVSGICREYFKT
jgi:hypothetical protein